VGDVKNMDENYFCHVVIPSKDYQKSRVFFERVFGWKVEQVPGLDSLDILPPSRKGPSAELNSEEEAIVPSIYATDMNSKLADREVWRQETEG